MGKLAKAHASRPSEDGRDDLEILHPERTLSVGGREVTVREYGFLEGLRLASAAQPLVDALAAAALADPNGQLGLDAVTTVLSASPEALIACVARAADVEPAWVEALDDADGQLLLLTWWLVNSGFFVRRVLRAVALAQASRAAGPTSTPTSSPEAIALNDSGTTPPAS
ncbi:MAG: hypothetical protein JSR26_03890 [Proteobacteria bacterium]|nr:hypothetical protein [Pseudomonadota bacterium]